MIRAWQVSYVIRRNGKPFTRVLTFKTDAEARKRSRDIEPHKYPKVTETAVDHDFDKWSK